MIPASNQKLFVTAALLAELGPTARLETRVYARGKLGGRGDSVVGGDLVLVGDGDPSFGTGASPAPTTSPRPGSRSWLATSPPPG